jgi:hypothetical protein
LYHSTADSASETISITNSDARGAFAPTARSYCELIASQEHRHADGDRAASERFYRIVLGALEIEPTRDDASIIAWDDFAILAADLEHPPTPHVHLAFVAPSREYVDAFWRARVSAGYEDAGHPGDRPQYRPDYYGAFVLDPDGNSAEAVHGDTRPSKTFITQLSRLATSQTRQRISRPAKHRP